MKTPDDQPSGVPEYPTWRTVTLPDGKRARVTTKTVDGRRLVAVQPIHNGGNDGS